MPSWIIDTNVVVAAHLSPYAQPARILGEVYARRLRIAYDARIAAEYREVLLRKKFGLPSVAVTRFMQLLEDQDLVAPIPVSVELPDPDDAIFIEAAAATVDRVLVTGNLRHFPSRVRRGIHVLDPATAWSRLSNG